MKKYEMITVANYLAKEEIKYVSITEEEISDKLKKFLVTSTVNLIDFLTA